MGKFLEGLLLFIAASLAIAALCILVGYGALLVLPAFYHKMWASTIRQMSDNFAVFGQFGDSFGVVTAIATVGALLMLYRAYLLQKDELRNLRAASEKQTAASERQAFESILFSMCRLYSDILSQTVAHYTVQEENPAYGIMTITGVREQERYIDVTRKVSGREGMATLIKYANVSGIKLRFFLDNMMHAFSPYEGCFRLLHRILKFIDTQGLPEKEAQEYARIPRAMLSNIELEAIFINCQTERGKGMKKYVEKFSILNNYPLNGINIDADIARELRGRYDNSAFDK